MINVLVTGADGQLGSHLKEWGAQMPDIRIIPLTRRQLDICQTDRFAQYLKLYWPDYVINAAAYTDVEKAEENQDTAFNINAHALEGIGAMCKKYQIPIIHISTDYVYHATDNAPIDESRPANPKGVYARSKYAGEQILLKSGAPSLIIRTSWLYSTRGKNFVLTMLELAKSKKSIRVVDDQIGSPTYAKDLAQALLHIIRKSTVERIPWQGEIYNYANEGYTSWWGFAQKIFELKGISIDVQAISSSEYPSRVERPTNSRLDLHKIVRTWHVPVRHWEIALREMLSEYRDKKKMPWQK